jgi:uncharacterized protein (TIGR01777 family)
MGGERSRGRRAPRRPRLSSGNTLQAVKVVIPGGSGEIGTLVARALAGEGHDVVVLSRDRDGGGAAGPARRAHWDGVTIGPWAEELEGAGVVINLAGRSVNCRYNAANRMEIMGSRVNSTRALGRAIAACVQPPPTWLQASTATIYAHRYDAANDERAGVLGGAEPDVPETWRFSIEVARAWERELANADTPRTRKVAMRSAIVMSPLRDGTFDVLLGLVRRGLGGTAGDGRQYVSWLHYEDFTRAVLWLIEHDDLTGPVNIAAPNPLPNAEFMRALRQAWGIGVGLPAKRWMLEVGAVFLRTETELVLKSRRVVSGRLNDAGFEFQYPTWPEAARDLCEQWRLLDTVRGKSESP